MLITGLAEPVGYFKHIKALSAHFEVPGVPVYIFAGIIIADNCPWGLEHRSNREQSCVLPKTQSDSAESSNKKLVETSATLVVTSATLVVTSALLVVTSALLVVTRSY